jgi:UDP-2-acetamido-3-amino-2,3-dideoxy-glucuronate N-acetyltransferase
MSYNDPTIIIKENVSIGDNVKIAPFTIIKNDVKIGNNVEIREFTRIDRGVQIGDNVQVRGHSVLCEDMIIEGNNDLGHELVCTNHVYLAKFSEKIEDIVKPPRIKLGASIGARVLLMPGIEIGKNSIVGANSMVNKNIPDDEIWFGSPAKFVRKIKPEERII